MTFQAFQRLILKLQVRHAEARFVFGHLNADSEHVRFDIAFPGECAGRNNRFLEQ